MTDALSNYKPKGGLYIKLEEGDDIKLRVLTLDPLISEETWEQSGETIISTKYHFVVYNWSEDKPQILSATPGLLNKLTRLHQDEDLPALNKMDIKITATGSGKKKRYEVVTLPTAKDLTQDMLKRAAEIKLEETIKEHICRLSEAEKDEDTEDGTVDLEDVAEKSGYEKAKELSDTLKGKTKVTQATNTKPITKEEVAEAMDIPVEDLEDVIEETINLEDIPF